MNDSDCSPFGNRIGANVGMGERQSGGNGKLENEDGMDHCEDEHKRRPVDCDCDLLQFLLSDMLQVTLLLSCPFRHP